MKCPLLHSKYVSGCVWLFFSCDLMFVLGMGVANFGSRNSVCFDYLELSVRLVHCEMYRFLLLELNKINAWTFEKVDVILNVLSINYYFALFINCGV